MATTAIVGTLNIYLDDGEGEVLVASLLSCRLSVKTSMRPAMAPEEDSTWEFFIPGIQGWRADSAVLQVADTVTLIRDAYLRLVEDACLEKLPLDVRFVSATGAEYIGEGYVDTFELGGGFEDGYAGSFGVQGISTLTLTEGEGE